MARPEWLQSGHHGPIDKATVMLRQASHGKRMQIWVLTEAYLLFLLCTVYWQPELKWKELELR